MMYKKFLVISTLALFIFGVYSYFLNDSNNEIFPMAKADSSLVSSNGQPYNPIEVVDTVASDISFLTTLSALKRIKIDTSIFSNNLFNGLRNNSVKMETGMVGRTNPFAPINTNLSTSNTPIPKITTDLPTQITSTTATLNGTINTPSGTTGSFFEYGLTNALGTTTSIVKESLVGTFIKNVSGLSPKTTYFVKACTNINSIRICGEVVSFTTN
jgi:hypothetical protein